MWKEFYVEEQLFCNHYFSGKDAMNIIVTHTPITSTSLLMPAYEPLTKYDVNIFAFDFSGTGQSREASGDFSLESLVFDMKLIVNYISKNFSDNIHIFGNTGIGGIFAQYTVNAGIDTKIKSFAQFACAVHRDVSPMEKSLSLVKLMYYIARVFPNLKIGFEVPKYTGFNADKDNAFYEKLEELAPGAMQTKLSFLSTMIGSIVLNKSVLQNDIKCPTLVFKVMHDRYFPTQYFDKYYAGLKCEKRLVEINDAHNSYFWDGELFCKHVYEWFAEHS